MFRGILQLGRLFSESEGLRLARLAEITWPGSRFDLPPGIKNFQNRKNYIIFPPYSPRAHLETFTACAGPFGSSFHCSRNLRPPPPEIP